MSSKAGNSPSACSVNASPQSCICHGSCDGAGMAIASGGTGSYSYSWSPAPGGGQGTANATGLCAGNYTVHLTDGAGCSSSMTISVPEPSALTFTSTITQASCSSCCDGKDTIVPSGGTGLYAYIWYPSVGSPSPYPQNLCPGGTYTCCISDNQGCQTCSPVTVSFSTEVKSNLEAEKIIVSPNPFRNSIKIENLLQSPDADFSIYNVMNQLQLSGKVKVEKVEIDTQMLPSGIYYLAIKTRQGTSVRKLIKE